MNKNITKDKLTTVVGALMSIITTLGFLTTEQGDIIAAAAVAVGTVVLMFAKDPK
jgi:hypothetical protein